MALSGLPGWQPFCAVTETKTTCLYNVGIKQAAVFRSVFLGDRFAGQTSEGGGNFTDLGFRGLCDLRGWELNCPAFQGALL